MAVRFTRNTSSEALDLRQLSQERPREQEPARKRLVRRRVKIGPVAFVYQNSGKHKLPVLTVLTLAFIFAGAAGVAVSYADVSVLKQEAAALSKELRETNLLIDNMTEEVNRVADVSAMRDIAINSLGMNEPKPYQILHITVPKEDYVEINK
jgi:cell division protein FtsB